MANIFGILTALVVLLSIWIGYKNNESYKNQIVLTDEAERKFNVAKEDQAKLNEKIDAEKKSFAEVTQALEVTKPRPAEIDEAINDLTRQKSDLEKKAERNEKRIADIEELRSSFPDPAEVIPQVDSLKEEIAKLKEEITGEETNLESVESTIVSTETSTNKLKEITAIRSSGKSLPTLSTTVKSVYNDWGFVTLNGGNAQGVVPGSALDVVRDGAVVAKLKVTAVEQNRASADILLDALPEVVSLRSGDQVVAAK